jgi:hypothetical protein
MTNVNTELNQFKITKQHFHTKSKNSGKILPQFLETYGESGVQAGF